MTYKKKLIEIDMTLECVNKSSAMDRENLTGGIA